MRFCRFSQPGFPIRFGRIDGVSVIPIEVASFAELIAGGARENRPLPLGEAKLLAPVLPGKIIGVGRNYADHARELGNDVPKDPLLFLKPPSAIQDPGEPIVLPAVSERVDFEGELAVVVGRRGRNIDATKWREYVFGYSCANDVTARDLQKKDVQFTRGKGFDSFCPVGPWIETELDVTALQLITRVNGETKQDGRTSDMIFAIATLLAYISAIMTLEPGDLILTGTPAGVGPLTRGDMVEVEIEGIGTLPNPVS